MHTALMRMCNSELARHLHVTDKKSHDELQKADQVVRTGRSSKRYLDILRHQQRKPNSDLRACDQHYVDWLNERQLSRGRSATQSPVSQQNRQNLSSRPSPLQEQTRFTRPPASSLAGTRPPASS